MKDNGFKDAGTGVSSGDLERGYTDAGPVPGTPPKTVETDFGDYPNPERRSWNEKTGESFDPYGDGFLRRDPHRHERN